MEFVKSRILALRSLCYTYQRLTKPDHMRTVRSEKHFYNTDIGDAMSETDTRAKVLCVDDDYNQRMLLSFLLERQGLDVRTASDGKEGVAIAQVWLPDLILMDLMMPGINGFEATEMLRADPRTAHIPILALTAYGEEKMRAKAEVVGMNGFVLKTILPADLSDVLREHLPPS
jgi:CheY-like chemotaxis protein